MSDQFSYCPICQLPLKAISICPDVHVSMCMARSDDGELEECPQGVHCLSTDIFHYRDFGHKLLAAYRSSSDFVPPNIDIKPSPRKRKTPSKVKKSPRKKKTPDNSSVKNNIASDNDSDSDILVQTKRPRRNLKFNEKPNSESNSNKNRPNSTELSCKKVLRNASNKPSNSSLVDKTTISMENCDKNVPEVLKETCVVSKKDIKKSEIVNVSLNSGDELRFTKLRPVSSLTSLTVTTNGTSNVDSDSDSETSGSSNQNASNNTTKVVLKQPVSTLDNLKTHNEQFKSITVLDETETTQLQLKEPVLKIERLKIHNRKLKSQSKTVPSKEESVSNTDFDDIIPGSMLDKDLLKTIETKLESPGTTLHSCSESKGTITSASSGAENGTTDGENDSAKFLDAPSSPEVIIPRRKSATFLSSSSDSDIPLSKLIMKKPESALNKMTKLKGKIKAGKVLRTPNKTPSYLNCSSLLKTNLNNRPTEINTTSDKESDSGKSSAHTDVSFVPSEKTSSSFHSDSAFSAQSTDRLTASSMSSTYTSSASESYTESRSSDPSYSEESDVISVSRSRKMKGSPKHYKVTSLTPRKKRLVKPLLSSSEENTSDSSSSSSSENQ